jgi:hypothetical protein
MAKACEELLAIDRVERLTAPVTAVLAPHRRRLRHDTRLPRASKAVVQVRHPTALSAVDELIDELIDGLHRPARG